MHTPEVLQLAHTVAGRHRQCAQQVVDLNDFRALLVNLFVLSVLHVHFSMADDWREGNDFGNKTLSFSEFRLACRSVSAAHANEEITEEQLAKDFAMLDTNHNNSIAFVEVRFFVHDCEMLTYFLSFRFAITAVEWLEKSYLPTTARTNFFLIRWSK